VDGDRDFHHETDDRFRGLIMALLLDANVVVPLVFSALAFLTVIGLALPWLQPDMFATRLKVIRERRAELNRQRRAELERTGLRRAEPSGRVNLMRAVLERLNLRNITDQPELKKKLVRAGWRGAAPLICFTFLRLILPLTFAGFALLLVFNRSGGPVSPMLGLSIAIGAALVGYWLPNILVTNAITRRQQDIQRNFPDALDLMVICVEAGLSLEAAFSRVSEELGVGARAIAEEIGITNAELAFLSDRRQALDNLAERTGTAAVKSLVTSLIQSERYGTPLGAALRNVSQESRETRMARAEEKAASLPAKLTVPMVTFFLPVLFMVLIGPTIIQVIKTFAK
jgi:tight adherence protein C